MGSSNLTVVTAALVVGSISLVGAACGGRLRALGDGLRDASTGPDTGAPGEGGARDANADGADGGIADGAPDDGGDATAPCDYDAEWDGALCAPPADDQLEATPPVIDVATGSFGVATFTATGPWATDPTLFIAFDNSTLGLANIPSNSSYGNPISLQFQVPPKTAGAQGVITATARAGNIVRSAQVTVHVTSCQPWAPSYVCGGMECGFQGDGCGGLLTCGQCQAPAPYCYLSQCIDVPPMPCPGGEGFDPDGGTCIPCETSAACFGCINGACISADSQCICFTQP